MQWWQWLLVIFGGFFLAIFFVIYFGWMYIKYKFASFGKELKAGLMSMAHPVLPQTLTLSPLSDQMKEPPAMRAAVETVKSLGFEVAGPFTVNESPGIVLYTTADPSRQVCGTV